ncbi:cob(I)yrinic acid a,c-diamide adenosyltransferase [Noviherbaspirillum pedocola]|uniref:Cobalamin adenosyltransferase n=1 Tax=Noviherbaspirillum pedocola TaxID=2801341 RepID=A0A934SYN6_9BURK|nr:cob(I)yrinic acid a,c-diamide adenosyltransferase [Noviherbaspirillum pedocola]MBK4739291.1 cob(I)yrinic acid a,c-diamide adenosyltransferase [Noviherbaspirillum pedocola]
MGNRLTKIYTRTGDDGTTGLGDGSRVDKDSARVEAMGQVDHLNAFIGTILAQASVPAHISECLADVQHELFDLGAELCIPGSARITDAQVARLERQLDEINEHLGRLADFILPGGTPAAALAHLARTACRNTERAVLALHRQDTEVRAELRRYLNRLSDLLFVVARELNRCAGVIDVVWIQRKGETCKKTPFC